MNRWQQHIHDLAHAFGVELVEDAKLASAPERAFAVASHRVAVVPPIFDETTYIVALHELGHVLAPFGALAQHAGATHNIRRLEEDAAWEWARHYALEWTPLMEQVAGWARATYEQPDPREQPPAPDVPFGKQIDWED